MRGGGGLLDDIRHVLHLAGWAMRSNVSLNGDDSMRETMSVFRNRERHSLTWWNFGPFLMICTHGCVQQNAPSTTGLRRLSRTLNTAQSAQSSAHCSKHHLLRFYRKTWSQRAFVSRAKIGQSPSPSQHQVALRRNTDMPKGAPDKQCGIDEDKGPEVRGQWAA